MSIKLAKRQKINSWQNQKISETNLRGQIHASGGMGTSKADWCHPARYPVICSLLSNLLIMPQSQEKQTKHLAPWDKANKDNGEKWINNNTTKQNLRSLCLALVPQIKKTLSAFCELQTPQQKQFYPCQCWYWQTHSHAYRWEPSCEKTAVFLPLWRDEL